MVQGLHTYSCEIYRHNSGIVALSPKFLQRLLATALLAANHDRLSYRLAFFHQ